jgi:phage terminase large subunit-like protein
MKNHMKKNSFLEKLFKIKLIRVTVSRISFKWFIAIYFCKYIDVEPAPFHETFFEYAESNEAKTFVVSGFRGCGKSTILNTLYTIWSIVGKQKKKFVVISCINQPLAKQSLKNIRDCFESDPLFRNDFGPFKEISDNWTAGSIELAWYNARITATSSGESVRGIRHNEFRPDLMIIDDIETTESARNQDSRDKTEQFLKTELIPAGTKDTKVIVIGNIVHHDCLIRRLQNQITNKRLDGKYIEVPIIDKDNNSNWLAMYPDSNAIEQMKKKIGDDKYWAREYLLKYVEDDDQIITHSMIRYYDRASIKDEEIVKTFLSVDLAISDKNTADDTAMVIFHVVKRNKMTKLFIDPFVVNKKMNFYKTIEKIQKLNQRFAFSEVIVENNAYQQAMVEALRKRKFAVTGLHSKKDKASRLSSASILVGKGDVYFSNRGNDILINQLVGFGHEKMDDLADAFSQGVNWFIETKGNFLHFAVEGDFDYLLSEELINQKYVNDQVMRLKVLKKHYEWAQEFNDEGNGNNLTKFKDPI